MGGVPNEKMRHELPFRNKITIKIQKFDYTHCNALQCTIFLVFAYGEEINSADGLPILEHATYNCPCEKHDNLKFIPKTSKDCLWD